MLATAMMNQQHQQYLHHQIFDPADPYVECYNGGVHYQDNERSVDDDDGVDEDDGYPGDEDHFVVVNAMVRVD